ncbi:MATE family efflux transporter [Roseomonas sp. CCTCC AB2023176]|uniref:MATE family efflux transporter n=1 Tax=Roseomonas sp. CCTCC AB2023176 TaxID=3342640 RepID=UPI0035DB62D0
MSPGYGSRAAGSPWRAEIRATLALAWPMALTNLTQMGLVATDAAILGRVSTAAVAALALAGTLFWAAMAPCFGLSFAAAAMLAQERGRRVGHVKDMRRTFRAGIWAVALGTVPGAVLLWHAAPVLVALRQDAVLAVLAQDYLRIMLWGLFPFGAFITLRGFFAAMERPTPPLVIGMLALPLNGIVGAALVFGWFTPPMGVEGAAIASVLANAFMLVAAAAYVLRDRRMRRFGLFRGLHLFEGTRLLHLVRLGVPISAAMMLEIGVFSAVGLLIGGFGEAAIAAHAVALQIASTTFAIPLGIGQAATARVGLAIGAGRPREAWRAGWAAIGLAAAFMAAMAATMLLVPDALVRVFLDPAAPGTAEAAALGATLLILAGLFQLGDGVQVVGAGALRGLHDTRAPMVIAAIGYWPLGFGVGWVLGFPLGFGPVGVWVGLVLGLTAVAILMTLRWARLSARGGVTARRLAPLPV